MGSLCRQQAAYNPAQSWKLLAEAEYWEHMATVEMSCRHSLGVGIEPLGKGLFPGEVVVFAPGTAKGEIAVQGKKPVPYEAKLPPAEVTLVYSHRNTSRFLDCSKLRSAQISSQ
jgi:hypothetical protein